METHSISEEAEFRHHRLSMTGLVTCNTFPTGVSLPVSLTYLEELDELIQASPEIRTSFREIMQDSDQGRLGNIGDKYSIGLTFTSITHFCESPEHLQEVILFLDKTSDRTRSNMLRAYEGRYSGRALFHCRFLV